VEILIAYFYKKSIEMKKLRTVIIGKENGLSPDEIKARLGYVG
jgi:vacuolar-type H+-ATPase subunit C/Vma6